jgi:23S rRNA (cytidine1920-2'-O)/16S rRNA (cytidine1409-2'-O)-methyltransferase
MKKRLDIILVERELAPTRTRAQALIMAGQVSTAGRILDKPGQTFDEAIELHLKTQPKYVSRAGDKLASVAAELKLDFGGMVLLDAGSSTGGFTDFALQNGTLKSYCVDVGTGQLAYKLRQDPRAIVMERTDIRVAKLPEQPDLAVIDVSFISLTKILEHVADLVKPGAPIVAMAKPQFEAGKALADKHRGVIPVGLERDQVLADLRDWITGHGFEIAAEADSKVSGMEGNVERFMLLRHGSHTKVKR